MAEPKRKQFARCWLQSDGLAQTISGTSSASLCLCHFCIANVSVDASMFDICSTHRSAIDAYIGDIPPIAGPSAPISVLRKLVTRPNSGSKKGNKMIDSGSIWLTALSMCVGLVWLACWRPDTCNCWPAMHIWIRPRRPRARRISRAACARV